METRLIGHIEVPPLKNRLATFITHSVVKLPDLIHHYDWNTDCLMFITASDLMTKTNFMGLPKKSLKLLRQAFAEFMNFNDIMDPITSRFKQGEKSAIFLENFWCLNDHIEKIPYGSVTKWFELNRKINIISDQFNRDVKIEWSLLENDTLTQNLKLVFDRFEDKSSADKAILFRALSSIGFAYGLIGMKKHELTNKELFDAVIRSGAMTLATQTIDDFWKLRRDHEHNIAGIGQSLVKMNKGNPLQLQDDDLQRCIIGIKSVVLGCLDVMDIDRKSQIKHSVAKGGLSLFSLFRIITNTRVASKIKMEQGMWFTKTLKYGLKLLASKEVDQEIRRTTIDALNMATNILI